MGVFMLSCVYAYSLAMYKSLVYSHEIKWKKSPISSSSTRLGKLYFFKSLFTYLFIPLILSSITLFYMTLFRFSCGGDRCTLVASVLCKTG